MSQVAFNVALHADVLGKVVSAALRQKYARNNLQMRKIPTVLVATDAQVWWSADWKHQLRTLTYLAYCFCCMFVPSASSSGCEEYSLNWQAVRPLGSVRSQAFACCIELR